MTRLSAIVLLLAATFAIAQTAATGPASAPASAPSTKPKAAKPKTTTAPTEADIALAAQYKRVVAEVKDIPAAQELLNWDASEMKEWIIILSGERPAAPWEFNRPRIIVKDAVGGLEAVKKLPPARSFALHKAKGPVTIDGKLDEKAWEGATTVEDLYELGQSAPAATMQPTKVKMMWDEKYLYFGFICEDANIDLTPVKRDGDTYNHDCIEIFLMPKYPNYWEINITPAGCLYDARMKKRGDNYGGDSNVEASAEGLKFQTTFTGPANAPTGYITEVAFPVDQLTDFTSPAKVGDSLRLLATRVDTTATTKPGATATAPAVPTVLRKFYAITPIVGWFHNVWCYASVTLQE